MKLLKVPKGTPYNSALQRAVDAVETNLSLVDLRRQELATAKKHLISDKNRPEGVSYHFGVWVQRQRQSRIEYRFRIEALKEAIAELDSNNQNLACAIQAARNAVLALPWEEPTLDAFLDGAGPRSHPSFKALTLNVLMADELYASVKSRLFKESQDLKQIRSNSPDNFHNIWNTGWLYQSLRHSHRNFACRFKYKEEGEWLYLSSLHSEYFNGDGKFDIPSAPYLTLDEAIALSEKLVLELWQNWHSKNIIVEVYDVAKANGSSYPMSADTERRLADSPPESRQTKDESKSAKNSRNLFERLGLQNKPRSNK